jgi:geranylgeranyl pyrophosphate synthase
MVGEYPLSLQCVQKELEMVFAELKTCLNADAGVLLEHYFPQFGVDPMAPPAFVLLSARLFDGAATAVTPALFLEIIHLAVTMHSPAREISGRDRQLVILEGDYLYAHLYFLLWRHDCLHLLDRFARLIKGINEGSSMRHLYNLGGSDRSDGVLDEILGKQYGLFFAECCEQGALFAGRRRDEALFLSRFGHEFGLAYGFKEAGRNSGAYMPFLERALDCLDDGRDAAGKHELGEYARSLLEPAALRFRI